MNAKEFGQLIRAARRAGKVKQKDVAAHAGISPAYLGMIERGDREASMETQSLIADALGYRLVLQLVPRENIWREVLLPAAVANTAEGMTQLKPEDCALVSRLVDILPHVEGSVRDFLSSQVEVLERQHIDKRRAANQ